MHDSMNIKKIAGSLIWELSTTLNKYVDNEASCYRNSVHIKEIADSLNWLSGIHLDDWEYGDGFSVIYDEIAEKDSWFLSGLRFWDAFCLEVSKQIDKPVNYGIRSSAFDNETDFNDAKNRWKSLGYEYQFIVPVKGIGSLLSPNCFKLSDAV